MSSIFNDIIDKNISNSDWLKVKEDKINILFQLIETPFSISGIETDYIRNGIGKKAIREITRTTIQTLVTIIIIQMSLTFFGLYIGADSLNEFPWILFHPFCAAILPYILFIILKCIFLQSNFFIYKWRYRKNANYKLKNEYEKNKINKAEYSNKKKEIRKDTDGLKKEYATILIEKTYCCSRFTKYLYKVIPFTFRTIWIWTLIFGIATVFTAENIKIHFHSGFDLKLFSDFAGGLLKALIITIIAYIATNIIHELLQLREQYVEGKDEMKSLKDTIESSSIEMHELLEQSKVALKYVDTSNSINDFLTKTKSKNNKIVFAKAGLIDHLAPV